MQAVSVPRKSGTCNNGPNTMQRNIPNNPAKQTPMTHQFRGILPTSLLRFCPKCSGYTLDSTDRYSEVGGVVINFKVGIKQRNRSHSVRPLKSLQPTYFARHQPIYSIPWTPTKESSISSQNMAVAVVFFILIFKRNLKVLLFFCNKEIYGIKYYAPSLQCWRSSVGVLRAFSDSRFKTLKWYWLMMVQQTIPPQW